MSIVSEIERLTEAKDNIRSSIESRGVSMDESSTIDTYAQKIDLLPCVIVGTFTPEEDTNEFELSELGFVPEALSLSCCELENLSVPNSIVSAYSLKGFPGSVCVTTSTSSVSFAYLKSTSAVMIWTDSGVALAVPQQSSAGRFKKGYNYKYVVSGGFPK